jgi:hypothetical protein
MSNPPDSPLFYTLSCINSFDGSTSLIGIFDSMKAIGYRLQRIHTTCGDEYHIDCYHLSTAEMECSELTDQQVNRAKYQRENRIKDQLFENYENNPNGDEQLAEQLREERLNVA